MTQYRFYVLSSQERITEAREGIFPDDKTALAEAVQMRRDRFAAEVWSGERLVGRVGEAFSLEAPDPAAGPSAAAISARSEGTCSAAKRTPEPPPERRAGPG